MTLPLRAIETFTFLTIYLYFSVLLGRCSFTPALAIASNHTTREDIKDRIILDHEIGCLHDFVPI